MARHRWWRDRVDIGTDLRSARHVLGLTLRQVAEAIGSSKSEVSRRELGKSPRFGGERLAVHAAAVGLKASVKLWPIGGGVRDSAQARAIAALVARIGRAWRVALEAPIPIAGDLRAIDVLLTDGRDVVAIEVITRLSDLQAQIRAAQLKARDVGATRLIIAITGSNANRRTLAAVRPTVVASFDTDTRRVLAELVAGRDPGRDAIILV